MVKDRTPLSQEERTAAENVASMMKEYPAGQLRRMVKIATHEELSSDEHPVMARAVRQAIVNFDRFPHLYSASPPEMTVGQV